MIQERQSQKTKSFQNKRSKEPSATCWTNMVAGKFMVDLQDFFYSRSERVRPEQVSREYAGRKLRVICYSIVKDFPTGYE